MRELWVRWLQDPTKGDIKLKLTHNDRDKGGNEAHDREVAPLLYNRIQVVLSKVLLISHKVSVLLGFFK